MKNNLPQQLRPLFWSYKFESLDTQAHQKTIITQVINYGRLQDWQWLKNTYGNEEILRNLAKLRPQAIRPQAKKLAQLLFTT